MKGKNNNKKDRKRQMENKTKNTCIHFSFHQHRNYGNYTQKKEKKSSQINKENAKNKETRQNKQCFLSSCQKRGTKLPVTHLPDLNFLVPCKNITVH